MINMTPLAEQKRMTDGQIDKAVANYRALLVKHVSEFLSEPAQVVLGQPELASDTVAVFRRRVEAISNLIVRHVKVNRNRTPQEILDATGRKQYTDSVVVSGMPRGEGEEVEVFFFQPDKSVYVNGLISDDELEKQYELRNLKPDPYSMATANEADPAFANSHPNGTHWKDPSGKWCFIAFNRWHGDGRYVDVDRNGNDWHDYWWFGGARK